MASPDTIIVGGCMRSGTTILQSLVCSTPATNPVIAECDFLIELIMLYKRNREAFQQRLLHRYFGTEDALEQYMREMTTRFLDLTRANYAPATALAIKNPELTPFLPLFHRLRPDAKLVVSIRDPRDTIASIVEVAARLATRGASLYVVGDGRDIDAASRYFNAIYAPLLDAQANDQRFAEALLIVRYEDLCSNPKLVVQAVQAHCGLDLQQYDPSGEWRRAMNIDQSAWATPLWGKGVSADSVGRYMNTLTADEVALIEKTCAPIMAQFGYQAPGS